MINIVVIEDATLVLEPRSLKSKDRPIVNKRLFEFFNFLHDGEVPVIISIGNSNGSVARFSKAINTVCGSCSYLYTTTQIPVGSPAMLEEIKRLSAKFFIEKRIGINPALDVARWSDNSLKLFFLTTGTEISYLDMVKQAVDARVVADRKELEISLADILKDIGQG